MDRAVGAELIGDDKTVGVGEFSVGGVEPGRIRSWDHFFEIFFQWDYLVHPPMMMVKMM